MKIGVGKNNSRIVLVLALIFGALLFSCTQSSMPPEQYGLRGQTMGTTYTVKIVEPKNRLFDQNALKDEIDFLLKSVNQVMSTYISDSELSLLNRAPAGEWLPVSHELLTVLQAARLVSDKSGGAFDVTVGPLVNLWGFGPEERSNGVPSDQEIGARKAVVGWHKLELRPDPPSVRKAVDGMYCDLSAIAKGYGVDRVAELLESKGLANYMVEIGGEIRAKGINAKRERWRIGVSSPDAQFAVQRVIAVHDNGVATSGDYRNYFEQDGVRYSHTIDPVTGRPITHKLASVTVIHPSCMMADAFATAVDVLGPDAGMALAEREKLPVFLVVKRDAGFEEVMNSAFAAFIKK